MKHLISTVLLCFVLINPSLAGSYYNNNDWRDLPFVEMMAAMIRAMNDIMGGGGNNYYSSLYGMPYSPGFMPGVGNSLYGINNFPNSFSDNFPVGQNTGSNHYNNTSNQGSFWDLNSKNTASGTPQQNSNTMNGIWQSQTGNVIAIYNNNRFIWSDGNKRHIAGRLLVKNNILYAYIPANKTTLQFQFYREPDKFIVKDRNARVYTFKRIH